MTDSVSNPSRKADAVEFPAPGSLHAAALAYASRGWPVFPCVPLGKQPACEHGQHDATTDPERINAWWAENPSYNVAVFLEPTGLCVVDLDGGAGIAEFADIEFREGLTPDTLSIRTPRGGEHRYFRGALPPTQHRIAPHIDTRGQRSYVLLPSSRTADGSYSVINDTQPAELPEWISRLAVARDVAVTTAPANFDPAGQVPRFLARLADLVKRGDVARQDEGGNTRTFRLFCEAKEIGLSREMALALVTEHWNPACEPPWDTDELLTIAGNAYRYAQNTEGAYATPAPSQVWGGFAGTLASLAASMETAAATGTVITGSRFRGREPDEDERLPPMEFWDAHGMLPKVPGAAVAILYAQWGHYKSTTTLALLMDAMLERGARVLYLAGEGGYGIGKHHVPAECHARGITTADLRGKYRKVDAVPALTSREAWEELIAAQADFRPNVVVIDTLATAIPGLDQNAASTGSLLTGGQPVRLACERWDALVIILAHAGKDLSRGIAGTFAFPANVDAVIELLADKPKSGEHLVTATVRKMRDAPDGHAVRFRVDKGLNGVPLVRVITTAEFIAARAQSASEIIDEATAVRALKELNADLRTGGRPVTKHVLVEHLINLPPPEDDQAEVEYLRVKAILLNKLKAACRLPNEKDRRQAAGPLRRFMIPQACEGARGAITVMQWAIPITYRGDQEDQDGLD